MSMLYLRHDDGRLYVDEPNPLGHKKKELHISRSDSFIYKSPYLEMGGVTYNMRWYVLRIINENEEMAE